MKAIGDALPDELKWRLSHTGLWLDFGAASVCVKATSTALADQIAVVYPRFLDCAPPPFSDFHIRLDTVRGWRRLVRRQVILTSDGLQLFHPFPADTALPLMEWGTNWLIGQRLHHRLLLHAGALERDGYALLLPATPGSGKSTLTAALSQRGWRLLSDEFGVCDTETGKLSPLLKPIALKNRSIDVIHHFAPDAIIGPSFPKTRKGTVAHVAAGEDAVRRRHEAAVPAAVILPRWSEGSATSITPIDEEAVFRALAFNSFNYAVLGATGFQAAIRLVRMSRGWRLTYSDLDEAVKAIDHVWCDLLGSMDNEPEQPPGLT